MAEHTPHNTLPEVIVFDPDVHPDDRGEFSEWFKAEEFERLVGHPFALEQANISQSKAGVIRGLHYCDVPPGQGKWVTCAHGTIDDVIVDIRVGSDTYGQHIVVRLDSATHRSVYIPEGFAHGFYAHTDATVVYLTTSQYSPEAEHGISPFDEQLAIEWPVNPDAAIVSGKDRNAPSLQSMADGHLLPTKQTYDEFIAELADGWSIAQEQ